VVAAAGVTAPTRWAKKVEEAMNSPEVKLLNRNADGAATKLTQPLA
jgi:hypothetical protein